MIILKVASKVDVGIVVVVVVWTALIVDAVQNKDSKCIN